MELLSKILQAVLEAALPILAAAVAGWAVGKAIEIFKKIRDKNPELYEILKVVCREAVTAAEQVYGGEHGREKLQYAINVVEKYLAAKGIKLDLDIIVAYIEAAVKDMNDYGTPYEYEIENLDCAEDDDEDEEEEEKVDELQKYLQGPEKQETQKNEVAVTEKKEVKK